MVDSILNAPWWPWSRSKVASTTMMPPNDDGHNNNNEKLTIKATSTLPSLLSSALPNSTSDDGHQSGGGGGVGSSGSGTANHLFHSSSSSTTTPTATPPDSPTIDNRNESLFDFSLSSFYNTINSAATNWTRDEQDFNFGVDRNFTATFGNYYTSNYTNDTVAGVVVAAATATSTANDSDYPGWLVPSWNCSTCRPPFDTFFNVTFVNQTQDQPDANDESSIYLIQIILTALVLGIVILSTVIGKSSNSFILLIILPAYKLWVVISPLNGNQSKCALIMRRSILHKCISKSIPITISIETFRFCGNQLI